VCLVAVASILLSSVASAQIVETRQGDANPMVSVFKSTLYGAGAGTLLGLAVELIDDDSDGEATKWGFVSGTFFGFIYGFYHVATRPEPGSALLEIREGEIALAMPHLDARIRGEAARRSLDVRAELFTLHF
jgi:hypothetical protein